MPIEQKKIGLCEIIKHALFQSPELYAFLKKSGRKLLNNNKLLLQAILWTVELKKICIKIDPEETKSGSHIILRAGHDISDKIEEELRFQIPHGYAVAIGIVRQLSNEKNTALLEKAKKIFKIFEIPITVSEFQTIKERFSSKDS